MVNDSQELLIAWDKKFELGIPSIDAQHEHLIDLYNEFYKGIIQERNSGNENWQTALSGALRETAGYVMTHFRDEETLMKAASYAGFAEHKVRHQEFVAKVTDMITNFDKATFQSAFGFVRFLYEWVLQHIAYEDKLYVKPVLEFYRSRQP
ncbi:bacteriohemerythrin [Treponema brennaborense]|uniref:Hemerythrin-like metal-binding protein n=1 Tax=Treponema brennaborense (strain DSM 12168 / CIP 105900 / DD5/3) TaxID=906968 RepID=F4LJ59_TREBD|nr:bacteriohemerythrin [Treponema brennaborense]AEE16316.1 hemerythrin-like metal-binding protein [Treponema brennaborense DSM 12168]